MTYIWVALVVVLLGLTAAVAIGRGGAMARAYPDRPEVRLPADRPLTAEDLEDIDFSVTMRGYRMDEVDDVLQRLVTEIAERDALIAELAGPAKHRAPADEDDDAFGPPEAYEFVEEHPQQQARPTQRQQRAESYAQPFSQPYPQQPPRTQASADPHQT
ncbi:DivIVA domain-containing protein [Tenggerimyces flavus]|uniref:DivIVA domain-containing protein n=1 Tax=Tenggerimyces flavus TaxID=1708749 RepID=A0ABV7YEZ9_9ACTN|nr:DivIVA domain-containing protein [Tenggerimyces flavus]MBM7786005.1 DivIVA domain-containing protein [Tenggerimyces flavus]